MTDETPEMFQARYEDISAIRWPRPADPQQEDIDTLNARHLAWNAWFRKTGKAAQEHGPQHDALLVALEDLVEIKRDADEKIRLLLAYGRIFHQPRPHTLESLGAAAGLSPSGVSRAFGAEEVMAVAELTGKRPPAVDVQRHDPDVISGHASKNRCTWGGSEAKPCTETPKYAVTDKSGAKWACCDKHLPGYLRSRV
ncbi:hypothetical protein [Streptomyces sp. NPDC005004]